MHEQTSSAEFEYRRANELVLMGGLMEKTRMRVLLVAMVAVLSFSKCRDGDELERPSPGPAPVGSITQAITGQWQATGPMLASAYTSYYGLTATLLPSGKVLAVGGLNMIAAPASVELYDFVYNTFSGTGSLTTWRGYHEATLLPSGMVLIAGGVSGDTLASAELYDPALGTFSTTGPMSTARQEHTATLLSSGKVLIVGGRDLGTVQSAELYDPAQGTFSFTGSLINGRYRHTATLLPSGKVLVVGGINGYTLSSAELYDPVQGTFSATGSMSLSRACHTAGLLPSGKVLIAGGEGGDVLASAELYDPALGTFSTTGSMSTARKDHTATLLPSGKILIAGGRDTANVALNSAELYDPAQGTFSATGSMSGSHDRHAAVLLPSGGVLVVGANGPPYAEVYDSGTIAGCKVCQGDGQCTTLSTSAQCDYCRTCDSGGSCAVLAAAGAACGNCKQCNASGSCGVAPDGASCTDGEACTTDLCSSGTCVGISYSCLSGAPSQCELPFGSYPSKTYAGTSSPGVKFWCVSSGCTSGGLATDQISVSGVSSGDRIDQVKVAYSFTHPLNDTVSLELKDPYGTAYAVDVAACGTTSPCKNTVSVSLSGPMDPSGAWEISAWDTAEDSYDGVLHYWEVVMPTKTACDGAGSCSFLPAATGTSCSDGQLCTSSDSCDGAGNCVGTPYTCTPGLCEAISACDGTGGCSVTYESSGATCDDGDPCTSGDICDGAGKCVGTPYSCVPGPCEATSACDGTGGCSVTYESSGATCDDGDPCTSGDICDGAGKCGGTPYACTPGPCEATSTCDGKGGCATVNKPDGTLCSNGQCVSGLCVPIDAGPLPDTSPAVDAGLPKEAGVLEASAKEAGGYQEAAVHDSAPVDVVSGNEAAAADSGVQMPDLAATESGGGGGCSCTLALDPVSLGSSLFLPLALLLVVFLPSVVRRCSSRNRSPG